MERRPRNQANDFLGLEKVKSEAKADSNKESWSNTKRQTVVHRDSWQWVAADNVATDKLDAFLRIRSNGCRQKSDNIETVAAATKTTTADTRNYRQDVAAYISTQVYRSICKENCK